MFTASVDSRSASVSPTVFVGGQSAALLIRMSIRPSRASVATAAKARISAGVAARSEGMKVAASPIVATTASPRFRSRPVMTTRAPWAASARAVAAPMPLVDPVTTAWRPARWNGDDGAVLDVMNTALLPAGVSAQGEPSLGMA